MSSTNGQDIMINGRSLTMSRIGDDFKWSEINMLHKVRNGIYQRGGRIISLLTDFGKINRCYPDFEGENADTIFYTGAGRRGDQQLNSYNQAMLNAVETAHAVPLFNKLSVGNWKFTGFWKITEGKYLFDEGQKRMVWKFTLKRHLPVEQKIEFPAEISKRK